MTTVLPEDFDGVFRFTNYSEEDFTAKWGGKSYTFPAMKTTPMIIMNASPVEIQSIRKKFAKEFGEREFFRSDKLKRLEASERINGSAVFNSFKQAGQYSDNDLKDYIQKCLEPLPMARAIVEEVPQENIEEKLTRTPKGKLRTRALEDGESLVEAAKGHTE